MLYIQKQPFASIVSFHLTEIVRDLQPPDTFPRYTNSAFAAANAFLVYLELRERVWWLQMSFSPVGGANNASVNPVAGFEGPLRGRGKRREREGREETPLPFHPEMNFWLRGWKRYASFHSER